MMTTMTQAFPYIIYFRDLELRVSLAVLYYITSFWNWMSYFVSKNVVFFASNYFLNGIFLWLFVGVGKLGHSFTFTAWKLSQFKVDVTQH